MTTLTKEQLENASADVETLAAVVNGTAAQSPVTSRTGQQLKTLAAAEAENVVNIAKSKEWANKTGSIVVDDTGNDFSAKEFAQGTQDATGGSAKNWAQQTGPDVIGAPTGSRSAKSWAQENLAGTQYGGSAKDWAQSASSPDGTSTKSAKSYATDAQAAAVGISNGFVGFSTKAAMDANLAFAAGALAVVTNDSTAANNGIYIKSGSSGSGSWTQSSYDRVALVEALANALNIRVQVIESEILPAVNNNYSFALVDSNDRIAFYVDTSGKLVPSKILLPTTASIADSPSTPLTSRLLAGDLGSKIIEETGVLYAFGVIDQNNKLKFAVPLQGNLLGKIEKAALADTVVDGGISYSKLDSNVQTLLAANQIVAETIGTNLYTFNRTTGKRVLISTNSATNARIVDSTWITYYEGTSWLYQSVNGGTAYPLSSTNRLTTWGDSLTQASAGISASAAYLGQTGLNRGASGYGVTDIAVRQGGIKATFSVSGNQIPASGSVNLTLVSTTAGIVTGWRTGQNITFVGSLAGVAGTLTKSNTEAWSFARTTSGTAVSTGTTETFSCDANIGTENDIQSIWIGRNNVGSGTFQSDTLTCVAAMVAYIKPLLKRYVVIGVTNSTSEISGTSGYNQIIAVNNALLAAYPNRYYDLRSDFIQNGLTIAGISPTSDDLTAIANDSPPPSLMSDSVHPNSAGYAAQKILFANWLTSKGYFA